MAREKDNKKELVFVADFETTYHRECGDLTLLEHDRDELVNLSPTKPSVVFMVGLKVLNGERKNSYENLNTFFNNIVWLTEKNKYEKAKIYFHNLKYDGSYILKWILGQGYTQTLNKNKFGKYILGEKQYGCLITEGKWFMLEFKWFGKRLKFVDMLKLAPLSLAKIGESLGLNKVKEIVDYTQFKLDRNHNYPAEWTTYLNRDVDIMESFLNNLVSIEKRESVLNDLTIGTIAYKKIRKAVSANTPVLTPDEYDYWLKGYNGGLCVPNPQLMATWVQSKGNIKMIDATSMYPSRMVEVLPQGRWQTTPIKNGIKYYEINISKVKIKREYKDYPILRRPNIYLKEQKREYPILFKQHLFITELDCEMMEDEYYTYYFWGDEWNLIKKFYEMEYKITNTYYFEKANYLEKDIREMYQRKLIADKEQNEGMRLIAKLNLNNTYGKTGQNYRKSQIFYGSANMIPNDYEIVGEIRSEAHIGNMEGFNVVKKWDENTKCKPVHLASYITSQARVSLINKYLEIKAKGNTYLYCDTDSIAYIENKKVNFTDIGKELGQWSYEHIDNGCFFCCLAPKQYRIVNDKGIIQKHASAGVSKEIMSKVKNKYYNYDIKLSKNTLKVSLNGYEIQETAYDFKKYKLIYNNPKVPKELN